MYLFDLTLFYVLPTELFKLTNLISCQNQFDFPTFSTLVDTESQYQQKFILILILIFYSQISGGIIPPEGGNVIKSI